MDEPPPQPGRRLVEGRWGWRDALIVGPIIASSIYYYVGLPLGTALVLRSQAVTAALVRGSVPSMILCGAMVRTGGLTPWVALLAPFPITACTDPCWYFGGRRHGRVLLDRAGGGNPRWTRSVARAERIYARFSGWAVFLAPVLWLPSAVFYFLAGETGMRPRHFFPLDWAGDLAFIVELEALGYFIGRPAEVAVTDLSGYTLWIVLGTVVLVVVAAALGAARRSRSGTAG
jgi:membrane protein DedA with SNARE-associated domain